MISEMWFWDAHNMETFEFLTFLKFACNKYSWLRRVFAWKKQLFKVLKVRTLGDLFMNFFATAFRRGYGLVAGRLP